MTTIVNWLSEWAEANQTATTRPLIGATTTSRPKTHLKTRCRRRVDAGDEARAVGRSTAVTIVDEDASSIVVAHFCVERRLLAGATIHKTRLHARARSITRRPLPGAREARERSGGRATSGDGDSGGGGKRAIEAHSHDARCVAEAIIFVFCYQNS